jgi:hypothetical protein
LLLEVLSFILRKVLGLQMWGSGTKYQAIVASTRLEAAGICIGSR